MIAVTAADLTIGFPAGINVALPEALLFYPSMGYLAQLALHVIPFALILATARLLFRSMSEDRRIWLAILLAASIESVFQITMSASQSSLLPVFVSVHLFAFGTAELLLFRRLDFLAMYTFRLTYYVYWHLLWGWLRLQ
jgi:hypothetical protein